MNWMDAIKIGTVIIGSLGGGGAIVFALALRQAPGLAASKVTAVYGRLVHAGTLAITAAAHRFARGANLPAGRVGCRVLATIDVLAVAGASAIGYLARARVTRAARSAFHGAAFAFMT